MTSSLPTVPTTPIPNPIPDVSVANTNQKLATEKILSSGTFTSGEHSTKGTVTIMDDEGIPIIQFDEDFQTSAGPDLFVILHVNKDVLATTNPPAYSLKEGEYVAIAPLKATQGVQNYSLPAAIILENYQSVAIWCRQFNATFGTASIQPSN
ncbi:MAG: DM13 domain-containing protein [Symploca sp. SIO2B6]|nr:DM13 domain-containing protein [Symploca sp. SIO2B6]